MEIIKSAFNFLVVLSVLVIVHEWGHYIVAKWCGMRVEDFSLFFGKVIYRIGERNGTVYNIRAIPLGGFVKIAGMEPDDVSNGAPLFRAAKYKHDKLLSGLSEEDLKEINFDHVSERISDAVHQAVGEDGHVTEAGERELNALLITSNLTVDEHRYIETVLQTTSHEPDPAAYNQKPIWQRAAVIFAGPFMSLLFGYLLFCVMGVTTGMPGGQEVYIQRLIPGKPAQLAGLKEGDRILQVNGKKVELWITDVYKPISESAGKPVSLLIARGGAEETITVTPKSEEADFNENGKTVKKPIGRIGFEPRFIYLWKRYSVGESVSQGTRAIVFQFVGTLQTLTSFKQAKENVGGIITIGKQIHEDSKAGLRQVLLTAASLSIGLGIFNLFPIPVLDGGHLLLLAWEGLRRRKLSSREVYSAQMVGLSIILVLFVLVMVNDVSRLLPGK